MGNDVRLEKAALIARFVDVTLVDEGMNYRVGAGNGSIGQIGRQVAVVALRRAGGYEIVMQMESGKLESFAPGQLFPIMPQQPEPTTEAP